MVFFLESSNANDAAGAHRGGDDDEHVVDPERETVGLREVHLQAGAARTSLRQSSCAGM
jgi:hypothetical protein